MGVKTSVSACEDSRVIMGPKPYALLNYEWENGEVTAAWINRCLGFGIFASSSVNWHTGQQYEISEKGYLRDKPLLDWYVPLVRMLSAARWQPATYATVAGQGISCERFGHGDKVYFTLYNDATTASDCSLTVDLAGLGLGGSPISIAEIARQTDLYHSPSGAYQLRLEPKKAYIIEVKRAPQT